MANHTVNFERRPRTPPGQAGYAYLWVLMMVLVMGIYLGLVGEAWQNRLQREREQELLRVGDEIRLAIKNYNAITTAGGTQYPKRLQDLVQDPRVPFARRFLRRAYKDPLTGEDWAYIGAPGGGFMGVYSKSPKLPLKQNNFPRQFANFADKKSFADWQFASWPDGGGRTR
ncbi:type II secretion system pseudopilin TklG [Jeongeupia sp. HS-3]|uniref:type II secretion system protein n=1 Tax=Jeongeupia sp. HS-3 TaxID=1009682 RepID=UPI0018A39AB0|nr:type II secretion system protein [Jeongeupia sp. HS-3]BCL76051.1 type II secretion system pseudopilin TklG [Jeongeupia sp. HS-3]